MHDENNSLLKILFDGGIGKGTLKGKGLVIGELLKERRKCMVETGILKKKSNALKSRILSSKKKQGLNSLTLHYIVSLNELLMNEMPL